MGPRSIPVFRAAVAAGTLLSLLALGGAPAAAQDGDVCYALTPEEISAAVPGTYDAPGGFAGTCQWHGTSSGGAAVDVIVYAFPGSVSDFAADPAAVETSVAGLPALSFTDTTTDPPAGAVAVELEGDVVLVTVSTSDPAVDLGAVASQLASIGVGRIAQGASSEPAADAAPVESTHGDPCSLFSAEELSERMGTTLSAFPDAELRSCSWDSAEPGSSVSVAFDAGGLKGMESVFPNGEPITVAGQPAYQADVSFPGLPASLVAVDLGPDTITLTVTSTDPALDVANLARELTETAFGRGLQVLPEPEGVVAAAACQLASPEEVAAAAGLGTALTLQDFETYCIYEGGKGNKHLTVYVAMQDAATFEMAVQALGGTEIEGPGERSWWMADYDTLATRQGDLALQVTVTPDKQSAEARLQEMAFAIMEALLAP